MIKIIEGLYIADPWPAVYIEEYDTIVLADLHLGIEGVLAEEGVYLPRRVSKLTLELVINALEDIKPKRVILLGDVKHSFSLLRVSEWIELKELFRYLTDNKYDVEVIRGNHDNYLGVLLSKFNIPFHRDPYKLKPYSFIHGHRDHSFQQLDYITVMGNEHPSVMLRDETGITHKFKAFLFGQIDYNKYLMILPPVCELAPGSTINLVGKNEFLSPILKKVNIEEFIPYLIIPGKMVKRFPKILELKII